MATKGYEVLVDEVTVHKTISKLPQQDGSVIYQNGMGQTFLFGEVVDPALVAEDWKEALESGEGALHDSLSKKLKPVSDEPSEDLVARLGLPFVGYDDMEEAEIVRAMSVLPSATIQRIKEYEGTRDEARTAIVDFSIGFGEHPDERQLAEPVNEDEQDISEDKPVRNLTTREVPDEGPVQHGEGITGTGEAQKPYGVEKEAEEGDEDAKKAKRSSKARGNVASARRGRRERQPKPTGGTSGSEGKSIGATNDE